MFVQSLGAIPADRCDECRGFWVARDALEGLVVDRALQKAMITALGRSERFVETRVVYLQCPSCDGPMARQNFRRRSGIMVDHCPGHGVWFDAGELNDAVTYLRQHPDDDVPLPVDRILLAGGASLNKPQSILESAIGAIVDVLHWW